MLQDRFFALDRVLPLPAVGLEEFVEGKALHTSLERRELVEGSALHTSRTL